MTRYTSSWDAGAVSATILLIRHAHTDAVGRYLAGRANGVTLSADGHAQLAGLTDALRGWTIHALYSSPLERAVATAQAIADDRGLRTIHLHEVTEVDFGDWTGMAFAELERIDAWRVYNTCRSQAQVPNGESAPAVLQRATRALARLALAHRRQTIAVVTHAEVIRYLLLRARGMTLDRFHEVDIAPASVTALEVSVSGEARPLVRR